VFNAPFTVGQRVRLNRLGYSIVHLTSAEAFEASKNLVITEIQNIGHIDAPVWHVSVDNPLIDMFLLEASMFEAKHE